MPRLITSGSLPVTLSEAKAHLRVDHEIEDALIAGFIEAAVAYLDGWHGVLGRAIVTQTWELVLPAFPSCGIRLPLGPVSSVESIAYLDADGESQTLAEEVYTLDGERVVLAAGASWPTTAVAPAAVTVRWIAGDEACPAPLRHAILAVAADMYEHRSAAISRATHDAVWPIVAPYRRMFV